VRRDTWVGGYYNMRGRTLIDLHKEHVPVYARVRMLDQRTQDWFGGPTERVRTRRRVIYSRGTTPRLIMLAGI
jgi:hypothetical protein